VSVTIVGTVAWSDEFVVIDCARPLREVLKDLDGCVLPWLVVSRARHQYLYALHPDEFRRYLPARPTQAQLAAATERVLQLHETQVSTPANDRTAPPPINRAWRPQAEAPSIERYVALDTRGEADETAAVDGNLVRVGDEAAERGGQAAAHRAGERGEHQGAAADHEPGRDLLALDDIAPLQRLVEAFLGWVLCAI